MDQKETRDLAVRRSRGQSCALPPSAGPRNGLEKCLKSDHYSTVHEGQHLIIILMTGLYVWAGPHWSTADAGSLFYTLCRRENSRKEILACKLEGGEKQIGKWALKT